MTRKEQNNKTKKYIKIKYFILYMRPMRPMRPMRLKCSSNSAIISTSTLCLFGRFSFLFFSLVIFASLFILLLTLGQTAAKLVAAVKKNKTRASLFLFYFWRFWMNGMVQGGDLAPLFDKWEGGLYHDVEWLLRVFSMKQYFFYFLLGVKMPGTGCARRGHL